MPVSCLVTAVRAAEQCGPWRHRSTGTPRASSPTCRSGIRSFGYGW